MQSTAGAVGVSRTWAKHGQTAGFGTGMGCECNQEGLFQAKQNQQDDGAENGTIFPALQKRSKS